MSTLPWLVPHLGALHLGALHPIEQYLVFGLAFGPFLVLAVVIAVQRHREARDGGNKHPADDGSVGSPGRRTTP